MQLEGKIALVTGGTKGIGAATAIAFAQGGADVAINGRHEDESATETKQAIEKLGRRCLLILGDVGKPDDAVRCVTETTDKLGPPDILVHSAGGPVLGNILEVSPEDWHTAFDVHVHPVFYMCRAAVPMMQKKSEAAIVLVSSVAGIRGIPMNIAYQAVKGALPQLTRGLALQLADDNIRVNCVAPGIIRTEFHASMTPEQKKHNLDKRVPLHREGTPDQVATLIVEMVTNDYITGETFVVDGGLSMRVA